VKLAIASGKGGTGKSSIATNLAYLLAESGRTITVLDCDVEEPNCHLFLRGQTTNEELASVKVPTIDPCKCIGCQDCASACRYKALCVLGKTKPFNVMVFHELCHSCGACSIVCPSGAISETDRVIGKTISTTVPISSSYSLSLVYGVLNIGEAKSPPLIRQLRERSYPSSHQIIDAPPGTSCAPISAVEDSDYVLMVAEPTAFGANDLVLALDMVKAIGVPRGIVINKAGSNNSLIEKIAQERGIAIIARIPENRAIAECYANGELIVQALPNMKSYFKPIVELVERLISND
jgi:MinD superfamily P-loop ATPase